MVRTIHSFIRRSGRITAAQQRAWDTLWTRYGVSHEQQLDLDKLFCRSAARHLEIGFGNGEALLTMAKNHAEHDYLGIEVHRAGIGHLLLTLEAAQITNVRIICGDAVEIFQHSLPLASLDVVYLFFPDPWQKKRHHKRRLVQPEFINLLAQRMKSGGRIHLATDWQDYAECMLQVFENSSEFSNCIAKASFAPRAPERLITKFEQRGLRLGHEVWDLCYQRQ
jgi:tRNA (guanine-N7-)-methyltransferase